MELASSRTRLCLVVFGCAAVPATLAVLVVERHVLSVNHPDAAAAASGMYAAGDWLLEWFLSGLLLVASFFLVLAIYKWEPAYSIYPRVLFGLSLTAALSVGLLSIPAVSQGVSLPGCGCVFRLTASPGVIVEMGISRLFARFPAPSGLPSTVCSSRCWP